MTAGRAKAYAPVNMVLHPFAVETVFEFQQMLQIKEIGFLRLVFAFSQLREACVFLYWIFTKTLSRTRNPFKINNYAELSMKAAVMEKRMEQSILQ